MRVPIALLSLALALPGVSAEAKPGAASPTEAPGWTRDELKRTFAQIQNAARAPSVAIKDQGLATVAGAAYRVPAQPGERTEAYAKRVLRKRAPDHPAVKRGQWLTALMRQLYLDLSKRCRLVSRFERSRDTRRYFEQMSAQTAQVADQLGKQLELIVEGLDQVTEPLPAVGGQEPEELGVLARVHSGGVVTIQRLDRARFENHLPPDSPRTKGGALKEIYGAQKQFNQFAATIGKYDGAHAKTRGHVQVLLPASYPAIYLNEIARGGLEAGMHTLHLKTMTKRGELRELRLALTSKKQKRRRGKRAKKLVPVSCEDAQPMSLCAKKLRKASKAGRPYYQTR